MKPGNQFFPGVIHRERTDGANSYKIARIIAFLADEKRFAWRGPFHSVKGALFVYITLFAYK